VEDPFHRDDACRHRLSSLLCHCCLARSSTELICICIICATSSHDVWTIWSTSYYLNLCYWCIFLRLWTFGTFYITVYLCIWL
jgi:hypothetical protein